MHRRLALGFLLAPTLFSLAFFTLACGGGAEKSVLDGFFRAARMRDNATLSNIATVSYDARTLGQVESFSVTNVGEEKVEPLQLKTLAATYDEAKKADDEFTKNKMAYQDQHAEELKAFEDARKGGPQPKGKAAKTSAEFQTAWTKWVDDTKVSAKKVSEAREKLATARAIADVSVMNPQNPVDPTQYDGEMATKDYTISAKIITPDGQHVTKTMLVTIQQARLKGDKPVTGKWIVTGLKEVGAAGTN
jgi:hypothetical protein